MTIVVIIITLIVGDAMLACFLWMTFSELQEMRVSCIRNGYGKWHVDSKGATEFQIIEKEKPNQVVSLEGEQTDTMTG